MTDPRPDVGPDGVPRCSDSCPAHDGKRCELMGQRPDGICEPRVVEIVAESKAAEAALLRVRRFVWERLLCTDGGGAVVRDIDAALPRRDRP